MTVDDVIHEINCLILDYDFPIVVIQDIEKRLSDCYDMHYAKQQLRYLKNVINAGKALKRRG